MRNVIKIYLSPTKSHHSLETADATILLLVRAENRKLDTPSDTIARSDLSVETSCTFIHKKKYIVQSHFRVGGTHLVSNQGKKSAQLGKRRIFTR